MLSRWIGRNDGFASARGEPVAELARIIGAVGEQLLGRGAALKDTGGAGQVMGVAGRQGEGKGPAGLVCQGMNFGSPSAARTSDGLVESPPFAPAAER